MKHILVLGAGLSASSLIDFFANKREEKNWEITVCDANEATLEKKAISRGLNAKVFDVNNEELRSSLIQSADLVISFLPARFHYLVAKDCVEAGVDCMTPSYVSAEMKALHEKAIEKGVLLLNELGVDPGIDHMSAMKIINEIREKGGELKIFESFTGGLVAPEYDNNPWNYKFTWNPRNVVLAGQGGAAKFIQEGQYKYIPYERLFRRTEVINIPNLGEFEGYANRDSLSYRSIYGLESIPTIYRGTLRKRGFSRAWHIFVKLGCTDDSYQMEGTENMTYRNFINSFLPYSSNASVELKLRHQLGIEQDDILWDKLIWLDIFSTEKTIGIANATPAQCLQKILEDKWQLDPGDKDMIVMWHKFVFEIKGELKEINSSMSYIGRDSVFTAMSDTVGLPIAIAAELFLEGKITAKGVLLPIEKDIYEPVLERLEHYGISFNEYEVNPPKVYVEV